MANNRLKNSFKYWIFLILIFPNHKTDHMYTRRNFLFSAGILASSSLLPWQRFFSSLAESYTVENLRNNVNIFSERGGTIAWMLAPDGIVVVDAQFPESATHLIEEIKKKSDQPVDLLINTHHHGDHTAGNIQFKGLAKKVVAHSNCITNQKRSAKESGKEAEQLYADTVFEKKWKEKVGKEKISVRYFGAAHTSGDAVIHFKNANIAHVGDLVFNRRFPYINRKDGGTVLNWIKVLEKIERRYDNDTMFIFGHAFDPKRVTGYKEDIIAKRNFLSRLYEHVQKMVRAGKSKEDILNTTKIPGAADWQGRGINWGLQAAYEEITQK